MDKETVIDKIIDFVHLLKNNGYNIERVFLYGSYSRGDYNNDSDIDVMLVMGNESELDDLAKGRIWALTLKTDSRIEPYIISTKKFSNDDISPLLQIVKKEGIEITC